MDSELKVIQKAAKGNEEAFNQIIEEYKSYVFAIVLSFIKDYDEVENVAQEVFLQIYLSLSNYRDDNFKGWIGRITTNKSIDWIRKKKSKFKEEVIEEDEVAYDIRFSHTNTPENILIDKEKQEEILKLCSSIPAIYEETIIKFYLQSKSYEEIALEEGVTVKTVASRLYRGKNMLKEKWRGENGTL